MSNNDAPQSQTETPNKSTVSFAGQQPANDYALYTLIRVLTKRWKWILGPIVICELLAIIATLMMRPVYQATATIELNKSNSSLDLGLGDMLSQGLAGGEDTLMTDQQTETAILEGDSLALAVIEQLKLASQPGYAAQGSAAREESSEKGLPLEQSPRKRTRLLRIFRTHLKVDPVHNTRLIHVTYDGNDPEQAAQIANVLIACYKSQYLQSHYDATIETSNWLTSQLSDLKANVETSEQKLTDFEKKTGILSLNTIAPSGSEGDSNEGNGQIHSVIIQKLDELNTELTEAEANRIKKEAIYRLVQPGNEDVIIGLAGNAMAQQSGSVVLTQGGGLSNLQQLRQQQSLLKISLAEASTTLGENNRHLKDIQTQLSALDEQIHQELQEIIKRAQADFQLAQQSENEIRQQFDQQQVAASELNEKAVQFALLSQEAFSRKRLYDDLYTKLQEANVAAGVKGSNITIIDPARSQSDPILPKRLANFALAMLFGVFVGLAVAYTVDSFDRTVDGPLEIEAITGIPVIGVIPVFAETDRAYGAGLVYGKRRLRERRKTVTEPLPSPTLAWILIHPKSAAAEAYRALRTAIMLSRIHGGPKTILITSCTPGEGKTTLTTNLAIAYAQHNKKVLIIEADMRRPKMKHTLGISNTLGLSNVLAGSCRSDETILRGVQVPLLDILPAGSHPPMPSELLGSTAFGELMEQLRSRYDIILIDSPPVLLVTDAAVISPKMDVVIFVSRARYVTRPQLARAAHLIEQNRMPVVGFVLNQMSSGLTSYGYESYGSYYAAEDSAEDSHEA